MGTFCLLSDLPREPQGPTQPCLERWIEAGTGEARKGEGPEQKPGSSRQSGDAAGDLQTLAHVSVPSGTLCHSGQQCLRGAAQGTAQHPTLTDRGRRRSLQRLRPRQTDTVPLNKHLSGESSGEEVALLPESFHEAEATSLNGCRASRCTLPSSPGPAQGAAAGGFIYKINTHTNATSGFLSSTRDPSRGSGCQCALSTSPSAQEPGKR